MSRMNPQDYVVLNERKFEEMCSILGVKQQCLLDPDRKVIEKAFRRNALKCHPDKGGDPVVFKKLNDAYLKLIGHIHKLEQKVEEAELTNSILIEISKTAISKWQEKLKTRYGWFKTDNCKNIIFDGPYKQYMGRSKMTGNLTIVLYEDPPDTIPKIHNKTIQFDQWRLAHLAEFGIYYFKEDPRTPAPERKDIIIPTKTPKPTRRQTRKKEEEERKAREDVNTDNMPKDENNNSKTESNINSKKSSDNQGNTVNEDLLNNNSKRFKTSEEPSKTSKISEDMKTHSNSNGEIPGCQTETQHSKINDTSGKCHVKDKCDSDKDNITCNICSEIFRSIMELNLHKKVCYPKSEFLSSGMEDVINTEYRKSDEKKNIAFICEFCDQKFTNMVWQTKHRNNCEIKKQKEKEDLERKEYKMESQEINDTDEEVESNNQEKCAEEDEKARKKIKEKIAAEKKRKEDAIEAEKRRKEEAEAAEKRMKEESDAAEKKRKEEADAAERRKKDEAEKKKKVEALAAEKKRRKELEAAEKKRKEELERKRRLEADDAAEKKKREEAEAQKKKEEEAKAEMKRMKDLEAAEKKKKMEAEKRRLEEVKREEAEKKRKLEIEATEKKKEEEAAAEKIRKLEIEAAEKKLKEEAAAEKIRKLEIEAAEKKLKEEAAAEKIRKLEIEAAEKKLKEEAAAKKLKEEAEAEMKRKHEIEAVEKKKKEELEKKRKLELEATKKKKRDEAEEKRKLELEAAEKKKKEDAEAAEMKLMRKREEAVNKRKEEIELVDNKNRETIANGVSNTKNINERESVPQSKVLLSKNTSKKLTSNKKLEEEKCSSGTNDALPHFQNISSNQSSKNDEAFDNTNQQSTSKDSAVHSLEEGKLKLQNTNDTKNIEESANKVKAIDRCKTKPDKQQETETYLISTKSSEQKEPSPASITTSKVNSGQITNTKKLDPEAMTISDMNLSRVSDKVPKTTIVNNVDKCTTLTAPETKNNSTIALENAKIEAKRAKENATLTNDTDKSKENFAQQYYVVNKNVSMSPVPRNNENLSRLSSPSNSHQNQTYYQASSRASEDQVLDRTSLKISEVQAATAKMIDDNHGGKLVSNTIYKENSGPFEKNSNRNKTDLDKQLDSMDKLHQVKIDKINDNFKEKPEKKIDLSNKEVNTNRPSVLGPSRFDSGGYKYIPQPSSSTKDPIPRRNESVVNVKESTKNDSKQVSASTTPLTKSYTTADVGLMSPGTSRKRFDSNFNAVPEPFKFSSKISDATKDTIANTNYTPSTKTTAIENSSPKIIDYNKPSFSSSVSHGTNSRFSHQDSSSSSSTNRGATISYSSYSSPISSFSTVTSVSSLPTPTSYSSGSSFNSTASATSTLPKPSSSSSASRSKSETSSNITLSSSSQYKDFYNQIQVTKDRYKTDFEKAMNFDKTASKPPIIKEKLPRPDLTPSTLGREYSFRRQERESTVMKAMMNDRTKRGKSDDVTRSTSFRY